MAKPDTALTSLVRHVVDDGARTRRAIALIVTLILAGALGMGVVAVVALIVGVPATLGGLGTAGLMAWFRRRRSGA
jgi:hypothetical protein